MDRAGNMAGLPGACARIAVTEFGAAVHHEPVRIGQPGGEFGSGHQGRIRQANTCNLSEVRRILPAMDESPNLDARKPRDAALASRVWRPLPQVSDPERAFWLRAVDLERRRLATRRRPIAVPAR